MREGWSVKVTRNETHLDRPVEWYLVAEADEAAAVEAVRNMPGFSEAAVEPGQKLPLAFFKNRQMRQGEVAYLYRRGAGRKPQR